MLDHRRRRWATIILASRQRLVSAVTCYPTGV